MKDLLPPFFEKKSYFKQLLYLLLFIGCAFVLQIIILSPILAIFGESIPAMRVVQFISSLVLFIPPALYFSYCNDNKYFTYSQSHNIAPTPMVGKVLILSLLIIPISMFLGHLNEQLVLPDAWSGLEEWMKNAEKEAEEMFNAFSTPPSLFLLLRNLVLIAVVPALAEEFFFRGALQPLLTKMFKNVHVAIFVTAFVFSFIHMQFYGFLPRFAIGIYLGYLLVWSKSLWLPIIAHFMNNAISIILDYGLRSKNIVPESIQLENLSFYYPLVTICTVGAAVFIYSLFKTRLIDK